MLRIDVFLNLAKLLQRLPVKRKKIYGSLVKRKRYKVEESFYKKMFL